MVHIIIQTSGVHHSAILAPYDVVPQPLNKKHLTTMSCTIEYKTPKAYFNSWGPNSAVSDCTLCFKDRSRNCFDACSAALLVWMHYLNGSETVDRTQGEERKNCPFSKWDSFCSEWFLGRFEYVGPFSVKLKVVWLCVRTCTEKIAEQP